MNANLKLAAAAIAALGLVLNCSAVSLASVDGTSQIGTSGNWNSPANGAYQMQHLTGNLTAGNELQEVVGLMTAHSNIPAYVLPRPETRLSVAEQIIRLWGLSNVPYADLFWNEPAERLSGAQQLIAIGGPGNVPEADLFWNEPAAQEFIQKGSLSQAPGPVDYWTLFRERDNGLS
jgi:hypothetical protein